AGVVVRLQRPHGGGVDLAFEVQRAVRIVLHNQAVVSLGPGEQRAAAILWQELPGGVLEVWYDVEQLRPRALALQPRRHLLEMLEVDALVILPDAGETPRARIAERGDGAGERRRFYEHGIVGADEHARHQI